MTISGTLDYYDGYNNILQDYKHTSVYSWIYPESRKTWEAQLNIYAYMLKKHGYKVKLIPGNFNTYSVDNRQDLDKVIKLMGQDRLYKLCFEKTHL